MTTPVVTREPYDPPVAVEPGRPVERWIVTSEDDERVRQLLIGVVVALVAIVVTLIVLVIAVVHLTRQVEREGTAIRTALTPVGLATAVPTALVPAAPVATTPATVVPVAPATTTATPTIPGVTTPTTPATPSTPTPSTPSTSAPAATPPANSTPAATPSPKPSPAPAPSPAPSGGGSPNTAQNPGDAAGGTKSDDPNTAPKGDAQVKVTDQGFDPDLVNIKVGQSVTWTFVGPGNHAVFNEGFKSGPPQATGAFNHVFDKKGTYAVSDPGNPAAFGSVVVK